jgi:hypothetical protein
MLSSEELDLELGRLQMALDQRSAHEALAILKRLVPDYTASHEIRALHGPHVSVRQTSLSVA